VLSLPGAGCGPGCDCSAALSGGCCGDAAAPEGAGSCAEEEPSCCAVEEPSCCDDEPARERGPSLEALGCRCGAKGDLIVALRVDPPLAPRAANPDAQRPRGPRLPVRSDLRPSSEAPAPDPPPPRTRA
jgi:hypothetical protein